MHRSRFAIRLSLLLLAIAAPGLLFLSPEPAALAQQRGATQRIIQGKVENKNGGAVSGAIVYLKDDHTSQIKSAITGEDGAYRFGQLSLSTDYELWAAIDGKKSQTRSISSFDSKPEFTINLKIDK